MMMQRPPKRYAGAQPLDQEQTRRRGLAVRFASLAHDSTEAAMAFLNDHDPRLGGRPLDLATASDAGLTAVKAALGSRAAG